MRKPIVSVVAAALAGLAAFPATATDTAPVGTDTTSVEVSYADLNLANPTGAAVLRSRIDQALVKVCAKPDMRDLKGSAAFQSCSARAREATKSR